MSSSYYIARLLQHESGSSTADSGASRWRLRRSLNAKLDYRSGYFARKEFRQFNSSDRERQLQEALMLGDPVTDLSLALEVNYFRHGARPLLRAGRGEDSRAAT